ncbi:MAG TPA: DUF5939 domain-containing protein [Anaerolineales bacterium]|nr:DUF5939 domain-containing protein [Anaerolineales bacterium]
MFKEFHYRWEWHLKSSPEQLWPFVSDTNRFNRDTGVPSVERRTTDDRLANAHRRLRLFRFGVPIEWEEAPFEWARPYRFGVTRRYKRGPVAEMRVLTELRPENGGGSHVIYQVWARPSGLLGLIAIPAQIGLLSTIAFDRAMRQYDQMVANESPTLHLSAKVQLTARGKARLATLRDTLLKQGANSALVAQLVDTISRADDMSLTRLRPYALADTWSAARRDVLELCLWAVRIGLLEFRWDVLCPLCRGAKDSVPSLGALKTTVHCDTCNIDYTANFDRSVELTFRPNPAVREIVDNEYCVGGPQLTPHIVAQQLLSAGEMRSLKLPLESGRYRLRALELPGGQALAAHDDGAAEIILRAAPGGWPGDEPGLALDPAVQLENQTPNEQLLILERMVWNDQAVTAAEVTATQVFRDLFATEALRPGEQIAVGSITIVFTDLRDSTRLYREVGDAVAFGWVMNHYDVLRENIAAEGGSIVKTIGDAVMAVFVHPLNAVRAMLRTQHELAHPLPGKQPLYLKAGLHYGPCIAVRLNDRLDYFGSTVNLAARLVDLSSPGGIILSSAAHNDAEVAHYIEQVGDLIITESMAVTVKGFDEECVDVWRVGLI